MATFNVITIYKHMTFVKDIRKFLTFVNELTFTKWLLLLFIPIPKDCSKTERIKMSGLKWGIKKVLSGDSKSILQSLTTSKMRKTVSFPQSKKLLKLISGIMSNFWGRFFLYFLGQKKIQFFKKNIVASALKSWIKWS